MKGSVDRLDFKAENTVEEVSTTRIECFTSLRSDTRCVSMIRALSR